MAFRPAVLAAIAIAGLASAAGLAAADNDELKCAEAQEASWMSKDATRALLRGQGYREVRAIEATDGHCYEVYALDAKGENGELYLDPTSGNVVARED